jgi:O-antigen/teichoic acid export membrane protein
VLALWAGRDWLFTHVLHRQFAQRDALLLLWGAIVLVTAVRDQLACLLAAQGRFRALTLLTLVCALTALLLGQLALLQVGVTGALLGMLAGETLSLVGVGLLMRRRVAAWVAAEADAHVDAEAAARSNGVV